MNELIKQTTGTISYDFDSAKARISERLEEYRGAVFTEESKTIAKKEVANLRKEKAAFSDRVKEVKSEYMKPYFEFEAKAKELIALYDEPINLINGQVQEFEERRKEEKRKLIEIAYKDEISDLCSVIPLSKIYNQKWENATFKEKDIRAEMHDIYIKADESLNAIRSMQSPDEEEAVNIYLNTFDAMRAISFINERAKVRADAVERERQRKIQEEQERIRMEERERLLAEQRAEEEKKREIERLKQEAEEAKKKAVEEAKQEVIEDFIPEFSGEANLYEYRISLTADAKEKLEMFMDSIGIEWEMI